VCAAVAAGRALALARHSRRRLHICHVSTAWELDLIREARGQGVHATCEVTPHHLFLSQEDESRLGPAGKMNPPLRAAGDAEALWKSLDCIDAIASDHAPHTWEEKQSADGPSGVPGLETTLPLLMTAVSQSRLQLNDVARLTAHNPARIFGLKGKGSVEEGFSADLTLVDPEAERVLAPPFATRCNWSPYSGTRVRGQVRRVFLRGREVFADGRFLVEDGFGREVTLV
jgi:carbamoyl-phosphate synthase/aspartate carbamoyltransferase/dihydroorotase